MEWVETVGRTLEEAKDRALDQLGVDSQEAEFETLEEPKPGLFGRVKGQARVRARVKPKTPPSRDDRRRRSPAKGDGSSRGAKAGREKSGTDSKTSAKSAAAAALASNNGASDAGEIAEDTASAPAPARSQRSERSATAPAGPRLASDVAEREGREFLQGVLDAFGFEGTIDIEVDEQGDLSASISGNSLGRLIGPRGGVIVAIEELARTRLQHVANGGSTPRFKLDIGGYRSTRRDHLTELVDDVIERVRTTGQPHILDVVMSSERKLVHDRVGETASDIVTHSEGEDPVRRVVLTKS